MSTRFRPLPISKRLAAGAMLGLCLSLAAGRQCAAQTTPPAEEPTPAVAPVSATQAAALTQWVHDLDHDRFAVREAAQQHLLAAGAEALEFVGRAAAGGSLESSTRAVGILLSWAQSSDNGLSLGALEQLATLKNRPTEAAMASDRLATVREAAAMEALVKMGGRLEFDRDIQAFTGSAPPLQVIIGPSWKGGTEGLEQLVAVRRATTVSFFSATVDGDQAVAALSALPQVHKVQFYGTAISAEAQTRLHEGSPHLLIDVRGGARLGIAGSQLVGAGGAIVGEVQPGTAAEKAGLAPGDVIVEIAGVAVENFDALTKEIAKAKAGDSVVLKVLRPAQPLGQPQPQQPKPIDLTVKFEPWNDVQAVNPNAPSPMGGVPMGMPTGVFINRR